MKKIIVCGAFVLGALAMSGQTIAQAGEGSKCGKCCKPKTEKPAPAPAPEKDE